MVHVPKGPALSYMSNSPLLATHYKRLLTIARRLYSVRRENGSRALDPPENDTELRLRV